MLEGMIIFTPSPSRSPESSTFSIDGKGRFRILSITFGRLYKTSFFLAAFKPILGKLS